MRTINKIFSILLLLFITVIAKAQYKKASFFTRGGAIYELGGGLTFMPNTFGSQPLQFTYSSALETNEKNGGYYFEIGWLTSSRVKFNANYDVVGGSSTINGELNAKRGGLLISKLGYQYRFFKKEATPKFTPYMRLGLFVGTGFKDELIVKDENGVNEVYNYDKEIGDREVNIAVNTGIGGTYYFSEKFGIRIGLEYNFMVGKDKNQEYNLPIVQRYESFPSAIIALRYRIPFE